MYNIQSTVCKVSKVGWISLRYSKRSWIDQFLVNGTQNPFSDSFEFKNPIMDFLKVPMK